MEQRYTRGVSRTAVIVSLVIALALACAVLLTNPRPTEGSRASSELLMDVPPERITGVTIAWPDGSGWAFERLSVAEGWRAVRLGTTTPVWLGESRAVGGFVKLLAQTRTKPMSGTLTRGATIGLTIKDGDPRTIELGGEALGGTVAARVRTGAAARDVSLPGDLAELVKPAGVAEWRSTRLFVADLGEPSEVALTMGGRSLTVARSGTGWQLAPGGPAERSLAEDWLKAVQSLSAKSLVERAGDAVTTGLGGGESIVVRTERRSIEGSQVRRDVVVQELRLGVGADASGGTRFAELTARLGPGGPVLWGPVLATLNASDLKGLSADPCTLASRRSVERSGADVARMTVKMAGQPDVTLTRSISGWTMEGGTDAVAWSARAEELLSLLTKERAAAVAPQGDGTALVHVELTGPGGTLLNAPLALSLANVAEGSAARAMAVSDGTYARTYAHQGRTDHLTAWLNGLER